jgi:hypothetical protein
MTSSTAVLLPSVTLELFTSIYVLFTHSPSYVGVEVQLPLISVIDAHER